MKTKHTPEPWAIGLSKESFVNDHKVIGYAIGRFNTDEEKKANAARIVECVNACAGMEDPAFEIAFLREQLRECTDALRDMIEGTTLEVSAANGFYDQRNKAKKVLEDLTPRP